MLVVRKEGCQMCSYGYRPHARAATAVGNAKGFVQVQMADVSAKLSWLGKPN